MKFGEQKQFQCTHPGCDKVFNRRDYLERHATNHLPVKPFVCIQCDRHFSRKDLFDNHLSTKRHARVANGVEHNAAVVPASTTTSNDANLYLSDEFDDNNAVGGGEVPIPRRSDSFVVGSASVPEIRGFGQLSPQSTARSYVVSDHSGRYADYPLSHNPPAAYELEFDAARQGQQSRQFLQHQDAQPHHDTSHQHRQQPHQHQALQTQLHQSQQQQQQRQLRQQQQHFILQQRRRHDHHRQQEKHRRQRHQHQQQQQQQQHEQVPQSEGVQQQLMEHDAPPQLEKSPAMQRRTRVWEQELGAARLDQMAASDDPGSSVPSIQGSQLLENITSWAPTLTLPQRRASKEVLTNVSNGVDRMTSLTTADLATLRSPSSERPEDITPSELLEQLIADDVANTDCRTFVVLRETPRASDDSATAGRANVARKCQSKASGTDEGSGLDSDSQADAIARADGDSRYAWFFDDSFDTEKSKYGYDLCYSESVNAYETRARTFDVSSSTSHLNHGSKSCNSPVSFTSTSSVSDTGSSLTLPVSPTGAAASPSKLNTVSPVLETPVVSSVTLHPVRVEFIVKILNDLPPHFKDVSSINNALRAVWKYAEDVSHIIHRPTFDANIANTALLSVLVMLGLALSDHGDAARQIYPSVYLQAYQALREIPIGSVTRLEQPILETLQAFCLLLRYEPLVLGPEVRKLTFTKGDSGRYITDRFLWTALSSIPHSNEFSSPFCGNHVQHQPIWSTACNEAFLFHQGAEPEAQWCEWALFEAAKRTTHLSMYCDGVRSFIGSGEAPISLFNIDIDMVSSDALWNASSADQFFHIAGPSGVLSTVPYLGLIKALVRFPRVAQHPGEEAAEHEQLQGTPWSMFALQVLAHGLIGIVGRLSGLYADEEEMLEAVVSVRGVPSSFDNRIQARLYRGLDVWVQNFNAEHGPVDQQPFSPSGSGPVPQYAMLIMLCHYASFIYVHEDVPIIRQVTANLKTWLENRGSAKALEMVDYLYMPLYEKWIKTDEAKSIVSKSTLYLAWKHAVTSQVSGRANYLFLSAMIYISTVAVWLYEFVSEASASHGEFNQKRDELRLDNFQFMDDAIEYLGALHGNVTNNGPPPQIRSVNAVILLSACMLHRRHATSQLVDMLIEILTVMEPNHTKDELSDVVRNSDQVYLERLMRTMELRDYPTKKNSSQRPSEVESEGDSDVHMSDVEVSNTILNPSVAMIA